jgi:hypothetical protein
MEPNGTSSNPLPKEQVLEIGRVLELKRGLLGRERACLGVEQSRSGRQQGAVLQMATRVFQGGGDMSVRVIHAEVVRSLGERIPSTTVRDALSAHSSGSVRRFRRTQPHKNPTGRCSCETTPDQSRSHYREGVRTCDVACLRYPWKSWVWKKTGHV